MEKEQESEEGKREGGKEGESIKNVQNTVTDARTELRYDVLLLPFGRTKGYQTLSNM